MESLLIELATKYQWFMVICIVIGVFRMVFKPIMSIIDAVIAYTPTTTDDVAWAGIKENRIYKGFIWAVDYLLSIKLPGQK